MIAIELSSKSLATPPSSSLSACLPCSIIFDSHERYFHSRRLLFSPPSTLFHLRKRYFHSRKRVVTVVITTKCQIRRNCRNYGTEIVVTPVTERERHTHRKRSRDRSRERQREMECKRVRGRETERQRERGS